MEAIISHTLDNMSAGFIDNEYIYDDSIDVIKEYKEIIERRKDRTINNKIFIKTLLRLLIRKTKQAMQYRY